MNQKELSLISKFQIEFMAQSRQAKFYLHIFSPLLYQKN